MAHPFPLAGRVWTDEMDSLLLYLRFINLEYADCSYYINREFGTGLSKFACIGRWNRLKHLGIDYVYNEKDFE